MAQGKAESYEYPVKIFLVAGEASGDVLGAELIDALHNAFGPNIELAGIGGTAMSARGVHSPIRMSELSVLGYIEGLLAWWRIRKLAREAAVHIATFDADIVVLIDSWGFTMRVAAAVKELCPKSKLVKYVGPQVWASRPERAKILAEHVDHLLSIHVFDAPFYDGTGLAVTFVGNPVLSRVCKGSGKAIRETCHIPPKSKVLLVLFGSRKAEFARLHEPFAQAIERLKAIDPDLVFLCPLSAPLATQVQAAAADDIRLQELIFLTEDEKANAFAAADGALACSGTVTTELAAAGVPMVVGYKIGRASWVLLKLFFLKTKYITLVNVALDNMAVPEYLQGQCNGEALADAVTDILYDKNVCRAQKQALAEAIGKMKSDGGPAAKRAAEAIVALWRDEA